MKFLALNATLCYRLTVGSAERLREKKLFDVMALVVEPQQLFILKQDSLRFAAVLWEMCDNVELTWEAFLSLLADCDSEALWEDFKDEVLGFSRAGIRPAIEQLFAAVAAAEAERLQTITATICQTIPKTTSTNPLTSAEPPASNEPGETSIEPPESAESILADSHFDSLTIWPKAVAEMNGTDSAT